MYRKVTSSNLSHLETHAGFFRLLMKGIFDPYVLGPFDEKFISKLVTRIRTRYYTVDQTKATFSPNTSDGKLGLWQTI